MSVLLALMSMQALDYRRLTRGFSARVIHTYISWFLAWIISSEEWPRTVRVHLRTSNELCFCNSFGRVLTKNPSALMAVSVFPQFSLILESFNLEKMLTECFTAINDNGFMNSRLSVALWENGAYLYIFPNIEIS